jgi:copper(I)-binding protein
VSHRHGLTLFAAIATFTAATAVSACDLKLESAWIREAPPGATSMAAYGVLVNRGRKWLEITAIHSAVADKAMLHESTVQDGVAQMRMVSSAKIAPGDRLRLAPGGKHLMLTGATRAPKAGEHVAIAFTDASGCVTVGDFTVARDAP